MAFGTCVIRYLTVEFVWVIFCWLKYTVSKKFGRTEKMVTFDGRTHLTNFVISNF